MIVQYFKDTDTAYLQFSDQDPAETREINEHVLIELDENGGLVGMTIEQASTAANISELSYLQLDKKSA